MKKLSLIALLLTVAITASARDNMPDTLSIDVPQPSQPQFPVYDSLMRANPPAYDEKAPMFKRDTDFATLPHIATGPIYLTLVPIATWRGGSVAATGSSQSYNGLMGVESGVIGLHQQFGRLGIDVYGEAQKFGYFGGLTNFWGAGGAVSWQVSDDVAVSLYGAWYSGGNLMQPAMLGYASSSHIGFDVNKRMSRHFRFRAGARAYRSLTNSSWNYEPSFTPYYRFSNGAELGIDIGSILFNILKDNISRNSYDSGKSSTSGPPNRSRGTTINNVKSPKF